MIRYNNTDGILKADGLDQFRVEYNDLLADKAADSNNLIQEIQDRGGIYYGVNAVSHNLIICNRGNLLNGNGFILGVSGSGKSMAAKQEFASLALSTDHDLIVVDPEREYGPLVRAMGGEVITISASSAENSYINALDMSAEYGDGKNPLVLKSEFIMSLCEQLMGSRSNISSYSGEFLYKCWKRFRKYGAMLTDITQNVEECLLSDTARMMFANSEFLLMFNQAATDREELSRLLGTSGTQMDYVSDAPTGHGLIKVGGGIVPFINEYPNFFCMKDDFVPTKQILFHFCVSSCYNKNYEK